MVLTVELVKLGLEVAELVGHRSKLAVQRPRPSRRMALSCHIHTPSVS